MALTGPEQDTLRMAVTATTEPLALKPGDAAKAKVTLRDGRVYTVNVSIAPPRPSIELLAKSVQLSPRGDDNNIQLASAPARVIQPCSSGLPAWWRGAT